MPLSSKAKEAIKTALAMTIAYGIALAMDWDKPMWAGFAVAFVSLTTIGQSFNKAALRMFGTLVAVVVAFTFIGLFAQDRWLFMLFLAAWVGYCTYKMGGAKHQYFWNVCGFVSVIICMDGGANSANAFSIAMLRTQQTGLGILIYSLVALFLWPISSGAGFAAAVCKLSSLQRQLYHCCMEQMNNKDCSSEAQALSSQIVQQQTQFSQLLDAAEIDAHEVREMRQHWRQFQALSTDFTKTMQCWHENFAEMNVLDIKSTLPNVTAFSAEIDERLGQIENMLSGKAPVHHPTTIDLILDKTAVQSLPSFHKAALAVTRNRMQHLETLTRSLFATVCTIHGFGQSDSVSDTTPHAHATVVLDPDRLTSSIRVMATLWLAYLAMIYVPDIPGKTGFVTMSAPFGMIMAGTPQLPVKVLPKPIAIGVLFGALVYIFVMPHLSSFIGLGLLIFSVTVGICYLFADPKQQLSKLFGLAMFLTLASIDNEQTYNFLSVTTTSLMFLLIFLLLAITSNIPFPARPELNFLRLLGRYFRSCEYLMFTMHQNPQRKETRFERWKRIFYRYEMSSLPSKLGTWARFIDKEALSGATPQQVQAVLTSLQALSYRMAELLAERGSPQASFLVQELLLDVRAWHVKVQKSFQRLIENPAAGEEEKFRAGLAHILNHLEQRIEETLNKSVKKELSDLDGISFYRLLGAYRGVSEALVAYAGCAHTIDWARWREERF